MRGDLRPHSNIEGVSHMTNHFGLMTIAVGAATQASLVGYAISSQSDAATTDVTPPIYQRVTSDLMNSVIQPRHIKLWLAGKAGNWTFAEYERHNIGGALARMAVAIPTYKGQKVTDMINAFAKPQLAELDTAIKAKDEQAFTKAFGGLTDGCNGCHQATNHAMVMIKVPTAAAFPDQNFDPPAP
jgi:hypothetical protein